MRARARPLGLRFLALGYLSALLIAPLALIFKDAFKDGIGPVWDALERRHGARRQADALRDAHRRRREHALRRRDRALPRTPRGPLPTLLGAFIDLPLALSPVVVGLALMLVFSQTGWFGRWLTEHGYQVMFAFPAIALATAFVWLPFVAREIIPVLREIGEEQQQAAATLGATQLQTFLADHAAGDPPGADLRHRPHGRARARRVRRGRRRLGRDRRSDRDTHARRPARLEQLRPDRRATRPRCSWLRWPSSSWSPSIS